jgi:hypothetical protein
MWKTILQMASEHQHQALNWKQKLAELQAFDTKKFIQVK